MSAQGLQPPTEYGKAAANDRSGGGEWAAQAARAEELTQLTASVAHDINNLLTVIMGAAEALTEELTPASEQWELALAALRAAENGGELLRRLLAASPPEAEKRQTLDSRAVVDAIRPLAHLLIGDDISLKMQAPGHPLFCSADPVGLEAALLNLMINARDAMPTGGSLSLTAEAVSLRGQGARRLSLAPGTYVVFRVRDTGVGMSPELVKRAVEPFFTTKGPTHGNGLGLSTARDFARQAGGHLAIASEVGHGARVSIYLPRTTPLRPRLETVARTQSAAATSRHAQPAR